MRKRGADLRYDLEISLKQAGEGLTTTLTAGLAEGEQVKVPAGVDTGSRIRFGGKGEAGIEGGEPGDLYVVIRVLGHELFERKGADLYTKMGISPQQLERG